MKKILFMSIIFLIWVAPFSNLQAQTKKVGIYSLTAKERNDYYESVGNSPSYAYCSLHGKLLSMTSYRQIYSGEVKEYLDEIFKYYRYDMFRTYLIEIKKAYKSVLENASKVEIMKENKFMIDLNLAREFYTNFTSIDRFGVGDIDSNMPKEVEIIKNDESTIENIVQKTNMFKTWDDFFVNGNPDDMLFVLKAFHIREWLNYCVEYNLPAKSVPVYKKKLEVFLKEWGI